MTYLETGGGATATEDEHDVLTHTSGSLLPATWTPADSVKPPVVNVGATRRKRRWLRVVVAVVIVSAFVASGAWGYGEHQSATQWQERQEETASTLASVRDDLHDTEAELATTEADLATTEGELAASRDEVSQLQQDNADISEERRQLADVLATAPAVTQSLRTCSSSMAEAVVAAIDVAQVLIYSYTANFSRLERAVGQATSDCNEAQRLAGDLEAAISNLGL